MALARANYKPPLEVVVMIARSAIHMDGAYRFYRHCEERNPWMAHIVSNDIARSIATKQSTIVAIMDCFASLAMTERTHA
jgi:hypothetical protein